MIIYGRNPVREALRGKREVRQVWAAKGALGEVWLREAEPQMASAEQLEGMSGSDEHQGVCAEVDPYPYSEPDSLLSAAQQLG